MKKLIISLVMLASFSLVLFGAPPGAGLEISNLGDGQIQIITTNITPAVYFIYIQTSTNLVDWTTTITNHNTVTGSCTNVVQTTNSTLFFKLK